VKTNVRGMIVQEPTPYINEYLANAKIVLTDAELFEASRQLVGLVESPGLRETASRSRGVTPLLPRLFAQELIDLKKEKRPLSNLPRSIPDLMLSYVNSVGQKSCRAFG
jgi:hypothetical protein